MLFSAILALALAIQAPTSATPPKPVGGTKLSPVSPALLPLSVQFDVTSAITARTYRIYVSKPVAPAPKSGYPVLYVLDADMLFPTAEGQAQLAALSGRKPVLVVGVGYPDILQTMKLRTRDLTPSKPDARSALMGSGPPADFGGADDFHRFMTQELRPVIAKMASVDTDDQSLMGYSLGGLFALHILFVDPAAYKNYVIGSPSIWWNNREVLNDEAAFAAKVIAGKVAPAVLITSDEWDQSEASPEISTSREQRQKDIDDMKFARMVDNASELYNRLKALKGTGKYSASYALFQHETHGTGMPASASRGVAFVVAH